MAKQFKIPNQVVCNGLTWTVKIVDHVPGDNWGQTTLGNLTVLISGRADYQVQVQTFWHEVIHVIWRSHDLAETMDEEQTARLLGSALSAFIKANKVY